jgi:triosephosphate isomerase
VKSMILAANWKLHKSPSEAQKYLSEFLPLWEPHSSQHQAWFFPPALAFEAFAKNACAPNVSFGLQNFWKEESGAFTGENSLRVAQELGATLGLIGHSERRHIFGETDAVLKEKVKLARSLSIKSVLCVGETFDERRSGKTFEVVRSQLTNVLDGSRPFDLAIAYEPVWAIGTGEVASPEQAAEVHADIRKTLEALWGQVGAEVPILYGGSVKSSNAKSLFTQESIDGFLVGGASLEPKSFVEILTESLK